MENSKLMSSGKVSTKELLAFSIGYLGLQLGAISANYISYFWTDIALIPLGAVAMIFLVSRIFDGVTDIIIGFLIDKTKSKHGKARPWLLWMAVPSILSMVALFYVPNISMTGKIIYAFIIYNAVALFFSTACAIPLQTLTSLMTSSSKERLRLNMVGQAFASAIAVIGNLYAVKGIAAFGDGGPGYFKFFGLLSIIAGFTMLITFRGTRERVVPTTSKSDKKLTLGEGFKVLFSNKYWVWVTLLQVSSWLFPALMAVNIYYMIWVVNDPDLMGPFMSLLFFAMFIAVLILAPLSQKIGKGMTATLGMVLQIIGGLLPLINPISVPLLMVASGFRGAGPAAMLGTRLAFTSDVVEYGEWKTGVRTEGLIFSGTSMGQKIGLGLGGALVSIMLGVGGYVGGAATQTASAISAITFTFTWLSAIASLLAVICLFNLSKLQKDMPQIMSDLEERKA
ncbi:MFS transporter [Alkalibaculum sp. M08DMB]|uniref:MFS transporter n=1 Tax=Alkalibaculum sporogenes TaxID=2655001 RepID=A0A6A7K4I9_9FIRM|nr:glycoside-pentoside-hexuronide (GPH):cation symporter [Alkalibaculum sporogenes]MPW24376.1 MFS transporter [Alkalibaculum sporogenes]